jgi:hypothetical protein
MGGVREEGGGGKRGKKMRREGVRGREGEGIRDGNR